MKPRLVIVDDHTLLAQSVGKLLEPDYDVVGRYDDARRFLDDAPQIRADVAILDVSMPSMNGLDAARELRRRVPDTRIVFLTMNEDPDVAAEAFRLGASGYLLKRCAASELLTAVRQVVNGRFYITPLLTRDLLGTLEDQRQSAKSPGKLTPRQREVLRLLADGRSMKEAAALLNVSARTIAFHKYRIMEHLQAHSTAALIQIAVREGLI
jgi:DNA-binding NarL/FixJ family response regulator